VQKYAVALQTHEMTVFLAPQLWKFSFHTARMCGPNTYDSRVKFIFSALKSGFGIQSKLAVFVKDLHAI
tara:strand:- start:291 stop:497 length:207 start_codon:yes stop_codon:yes gene_type:complete